MARRHLARDGSGLHFAGPSLAHRHPGAGRRRDRQTPRGPAVPDRRPRDRRDLHPPGPLHAAHLRQQRPRAAPDPRSPPRALRQAATPADQVVRHQLLRRDHVARCQRRAVHRPGHRRNHRPGDPRRSSVLHHGRLDVLPQLGTHPGHPRPAADHRPDHHDVFEARRTPLAGVVRSLRRPQRAAPRQPRRDPPDQGLHGGTRSTRPLRRRKSPRRRKAHAGDERPGHRLARRFTARGVRDHPDARLRRLVGSSGQDGSRHPDGLPRRLGFPLRSHLPHQCAHPALPRRQGGREARLRHPRPARREPPHRRRTPGGVLRSRRVRERRLLL